MAGGRPTDYSEEMLAEAESFYQSYFDPHPKEVEGFHWKTGQKIMVPNPKFTAIPYIERLALELGVDDTTLINWSNVHPEFFATLNKIRALQKLRLFDYTLHKDSAAGSIFQLKVNHGMIETSKQEVELTAYARLNDEQLDQLLEQKARELGVSSLGGGEETQDERESSQVLKPIYATTARKTD